MKYSQFSYPCTCECGKQFYVVWQVWGRVENLEIEHNYKCLKCTAMRKEIWDTIMKMTEGDKSEFQNLVYQNYQAVIDRGLINEHTDFYDFMEKLEEESKELAYEFNPKLAISNRFKSELIDCISVLLNMAKHYNIDVIEGLKANITKNQERAKAN